MTDWQYLDEVLREGDLETGDVTAVDQILEEDRGLGQLVQGGDVEEEQEALQDVDRQVRQGGQRREHARLGTAVGELGSTVRPLTIRFLSRHILEIET